MIDFEYILDEINSKLPDNNAQLITASKLRIVLEEMLALIEQQTGDFVFIDEDGLYITDQLGYILSSFTDDGFDAAKFAPHLIDYLNSTLNTGTSDLVNVLEDGLFITDENGYILASFTASGFNCASIDTNLINLLKSLIITEKWTKINNTQYIISI